MKGPWARRSVPPLKSVLLTCIRVFPKMGPAKGYQWKRNLMSAEHGKRRPTKRTLRGIWGKGIALSEEEKQR